MFLHVCVWIRVRCVVNVHFLLMNCSCCRIMWIIPEPDSHTQDDDTGISVCSAILLDLNSTDDTTLGYTAEFASREVFFLSDPSETRVTFIGGVSFFMCMHISRHVHTSMHTLYTTEFKILETCDLWPVAPWLWLKHFAEWISEASWSMCYFFMHVYACVQCVYICVRMCVRVCMCACGVWMCVCMRMRVYKCFCMCVCEYVCVVWWMYTSCWWIAHVVE